MAVTIGVNSGFVTTAPTSNPTAGGDSIDDEAATTRDTTTTNASKIIEIGWFVDASSIDVNFEMGLYADDGLVVPGEAGTLLEVSRTNSRGTTSGWKRVTVDWTISGNTTYWLALQVDGGGFNPLPRANSGAAGRDEIPGKTTLTDPLGGGALSDSDGAYAIYALFEETEPSGTNLQINIGDVWKEVPAVQINIGDAWKEVVGMQLNIGDVWKEIF